MKILPLFSLCVFLVCASESFARLGDTASSLDHRLTADRFAVELRGASAQRIVSRGHLSPPQRRNDPLRSILNETRDLLDLTSLAVGGNVLALLLRDDELPSFSKKFHRCIYLYNTSRIPLVYIQLPARSV